MTEAPAMKFCKDCKHFRAASAASAFLVTLYMPARCAPPNAPREPVYGRQFTCDPSEARASADKCGPTAAWFEERPPEPPAPPPAPEPAPGSIVMLQDYPRPKRPWWGFWL